MPHEDILKIDKNTEQNIEDSISLLVELADGVIISDYNKGVCSSKITQKIISESNNLRKPVVVDPKGDNWEKYFGATYITPNTKEASMIVDYPLNSDADFHRAGLEISDKYNIDHCLITRGADGMSMVSKEETFHVKSKAQEVYDVSGAGDTVVACLSVAILEGKSKKECVKFANKAAGVVVSHLGTSAITLDELS